MNWIDIITIILAILLAILSVFFKCKGTTTTLYQKACLFINQMFEMKDLFPPERMDMVVEYLKPYIPAFLKSYFTEEKIREIAQQAYDVAKDFREKDIQSDIEEIQQAVGEEKKETDIMLFKTQAVDCKDIKVEDDIK